MSDVFKAVDKVGRTLIEGAESAVRHFIESNFPRHHVQPGNTAEPEADVKLVAPDGSTDTFHADHGWQSEQPATPATDTSLSLDGKEGE